MKFAKIIFYVAFIWGVIVLTPLYFMFDMIGRQDPPPITHPGFYYGFVGVGLAWQIAFLIIARDPVRLRPMMIPSVLEKLSFVGAMIVPLRRGDPCRRTCSWSGSMGCSDCCSSSAFVRTPAVAKDR